MSILNIKAMSLLALILANCGFGSTRPHADTTDHSSKREIYFSNPKFNQVFHNRNPDLSLRRKFLGDDSSDFTTNNNNYIVRFPIEVYSPEDYGDQDEGYSPDQLPIEENSQVPELHYTEDLKTTDRPTSVEVYENEKHPESAIGVEEEKNSIKNDAIPATKNTKKCGPKFKSEMAIQEQKILEYFSNLRTPQGSQIEVDSENPCLEDNAKNDTKEDVPMRTNLDQSRKNETFQQDSANPIAPLSKQPNTLVGGDLEDEGFVVDGKISIFQTEKNEIISFTNKPEDEKSNSDIPPEKNTLYVSTLQVNTSLKPLVDSTIVPETSTEKSINKPETGSVNSIDTVTEKVEYRNKTTETSTVAAAVTNGTRFVNKNNEHSMSEKPNPANAQNAHEHNSNFINANIKNATETFLQKWSLSNLISTLGNEEPLFTNEKNGSTDKKSNHKELNANGLESLKNNPPRLSTNAVLKRVKPAPKRVTAASKRVTAAPKRITAAHTHVTDAPKRVTTATKIKTIAPEKISLPRPQTDSARLTASIFSKILGSILAGDTPSPTSHKRVPKDVGSHKNKYISRIVLSNIARNYIAPKYFPKSGAKVFPVLGESPLQTLPANFRQGSYEMIHRNLVDSNMERRKAMSLADVFNGDYLRAVRSKKSKDYMDEFEQIM